MPNFFNLVLDTTGPANPSVSIEGGATYATVQLVNLTIGTTDGTTTGYQMKIWGDVDTGADSNVQATEGASAWITYATSKQVTLSAGDATKTISVRLRDDVSNESGTNTDSIILQMTLPTVTISGPDVSKISKVATKDTSAFSFQSTMPFTEYTVRVVGSSGAAHDTGTQIPVAAGSSNMGTTGTFAANTPINCSIKGTDLEAVSAGDGTKIIKVFVKDNAGLWSA